MNLEKQGTYVKTDDFVIHKTGHDWDFCMYIKNLNSKPIKIKITDGIYEDEEIELKANGDEYDWRGFFNSELGIAQAIRKGDYEIEYC